MSLRKNTGGQASSRVHVWDDPDVGFHAECRKRDDGWVVESGTGIRIDSTYQGAVDWVMDRYRLAREGLSSWDGPAALLAQADGRDWSDMSTEERERYLDTARENARRGVLR